MLNAVLAILAVAVWGSSYALFFSRDMRRWWRSRDDRRRRSAAARERALRAYAAWVSDIPPPRPRTPIMPPVMLPVVVPGVVVMQAGNRQGGVVVPFPRGRVGSRR